MPPAQHEPEDILAGMADASDVPPTGQASPLAEGPADSGNKLRMIMIVLGAIAGILVLVVGGLFVYRTYFAPAAVTTNEPQTPDAASPSISDDSQIPQAQQPSTMLPDTENPPAVDPTPIPDIPKPEPVGAVIDTDGDGLSDDRERELKTDPMNLDTDGDGLSDGEEVKLSTDPMVTDTDADGLSDGDEVRVWKTDPKMSDTDGDAYSDGDEVKNNYNPLGPGKLPDIR